MSFHVYIARSGFKDTPIGLEEWLSVARSHSKLKGADSSSVDGPTSSSFSLLSDRSQRLTLDPHGLVHTQNPSKDLVAVMLELAVPLGAGVYSEKLKRYTSLSDWEERTRSYRAQHQRARAQAHSVRRKKQFMWLVVIVVAAIAGWFLHA